MVHYDLIVCGAGPAGAIAAATAAQAGLKTALLEKYPLPRHKTCGGGVPVVNNALRGLAPDAFVEANVKYLRHTWNFVDPYLGAINPAGAEKLSIWMVQRPIFDDALAQRAVKMGANLLDGVMVRSLELGDRVTTVRAQMIKPNGELSRGEEFVATTRYLIGADGANGITAKTTELRPQRTIALGMELELPYEWNDHPDLQPHIAHLEYGAIPQGYAWIFPKANHLNVGAGVFQPSGGDARRDRHLPAQLRQVILNYLEAFHLPSPLASLKFHAHPLPIWSGKERLHTQDGRILLAGDAAGLINPFFGDGILHAVKSGEMAATCVVTGATQQYSDRIHAEFAPSFNAARQLANLFYRFPKLGYDYGIKHPKASRIATELLTGELAYNQIVSRTIWHMARSRTLSLFRGKTS